MYGLKNVRNRRTDSLSRVAWAQLESLLATYYRGQGYRVDHVGTGATSARFDGGIDLKLHKDDQYVVVQCKHWNAKQVPHNDVHQLLGIMVNEGATGAILVSSGEFTAAARQAASKHGHVQLIDGDALRAMIGPLPEPPSTVFNASSAAAVASAVGERLLSAAEDRVRGKRGGTSIGRLFAYKALLSLAMMLLMLFVVVFMYQTAVKAMKQVGQTASPAQTTAAPLPGPSPIDGAVTGMPSAEDGFDEAPPAIRTPSEAEIRESQRKAEEAMKVLEASTSEV
jgi:restriction system protein